jgi:hypothetical protein
VFPQAPSSCLAGAGSCGPNAAGRRGIPRKPLEDLPGMWHAVYGDRATLRRPARAAPLTERLTPRAEQGPGPPLEANEKE